jgi:hypothetical protein
MPKRSASRLTPGRRHGQMNHSYKTGLLLFSPSFHSAVASAAKFSRHRPSQHTSFQRSPPTYHRMPFTKRCCYLIQIRSPLQAAMPIPIHALLLRFPPTILVPAPCANRRAVAKILVQVSRKPLDSPAAQLNLHRPRVRRNHRRPRPNGFTGRALSSPPPFTPHRERASGKALAFVGTNSTDESIVSDLPVVRQLFGNSMLGTLLTQRLPYFEVRGDSCPLWPRS